MRTILTISLAFSAIFYILISSRILFFFSCFSLVYFSFLSIFLMSLTISTDSTFTDITKTGLVLVDFWAEWCGPCQMMLPRLTDLASKTEGKAIIAKHDVDSDPTIPGGMRIMSIPTMILFKDGQPVEKWVGAQDVATLEAAIIKHA